MSIAFRFFRRMEPHSGERKFKRNIPTKPKFPPFTKIVSKPQLFPFFF